jgi:uncharacterized protein YprB with RNaseH-like and TPR domain
MTQPKIVFWDLENTGLVADFGHTLCTGFMYLGQKHATVVSINDFRGFKKSPMDDRELCLKSWQILSEADAWVTWYGKRYDVPFLNSRLIYHRLPILPPVKHIDLWFTARYKMKLHNNRLASMTEFLDLPDKSPVKSSTWREAMCGNEKALEYVKKHCLKDVEVLAGAYERMKPLIDGSLNQHLFGSGPENCPLCGGPGNKITAQGTRNTKVGTYQRFLCKSCGGWLQQRKAVERDKSGLFHLS